MNEQKEQDRREGPAPFSFIWERFWKKTSQSSIVKPKSLNASANLCGERDSLSKWKDCLCPQSYISDSTASDSNIPNGQTTVSDHSAYGAAAYGGDPRRDATQGNSSGETAGGRKSKRKSPKANQAERQSFNKADITSGRPSKVFLLLYL